MYLFLLLMGTAFYFIAGQAKADNAKSDHNQLSFKARAKELLEWNKTNNNTEKITIKYIENITPEGAQFKVEILHLNKPCRDGCQN